MEEGRKESPVDKKVYWKSRFSFYSQLSLGVFLMVSSFIFFQGTVKSCWEIGNPSLSENVYSK